VGVTKQMALNYQLPVISYELPSCCNRKCAMQMF